MIYHRARGLHYITHREILPTIEADVGNVQDDTLQVREANSEQCWLVVAHVADHVLSPFLLPLVATEPGGSGSGD